jgi:hypothetical protein
VLFYGTAKPPARVREGIVGSDRFSGSETHFGAIPEQQIASDIAPYQADP